MGDVVIDALVEDGLLHASLRESRRRQTIFLSAYGEGFHNELTAFTRSAFGWHCSRDCRGSYALRVRFDGGLPSGRRLAV